MHRARVSPTIAHQRCCLELQLKLVANMYNVVKLQNLPKTQSNIITPTEQPRDSGVNIMIHAYPVSPFEYIMTSP